MTWDQVVLQIHYLGEMEKEQDLKNFCNFCKMVNLVSDLDGLSQRIPKFVVHISKWPEKIVDLYPSLACSKK